MGGGNQPLGHGVGCCSTDILRKEEAAPVSFCCGVRDEEFGLMATGGFLGEDRIPSLGFVSIRPPAVLPHLHQDHISHSHLA